MKKDTMRQTYRAAVFVVGAALLLSGCGASRSAYLQGNIMETTAAFAREEAFAEPKMAAAAGYGMNAVADMDYMEYEDAGAGSMSYVSGNVSEVSEADAAAAQAAESGGASSGATSNLYGKLIRTVSISLETKEFDRLSSAIRERVNALGGYVESSNEYSRYNDLRSGYLTVRIPQERLDEFLDTALTEGTVTSRSENVEDITLTYSDIQTRVETLKIEQARLLDLLEKADDVESLIAIESRLSEISYEIENHASRLRVYDNRVSYSTVSIDITEVDVTAPTVEAGLGEKIRTGIENNLVDVMVFFGALGFALIIHLPALIVLALIICIAVWIIRKIVGGAEARKAKKAARAEEKRLKKAGAVKTAAVETDQVKSGNVRNAGNAADGIGAEDPGKAEH